MAGNVESTAHQTSNLPVLRTKDVVREFQNGGEMIRVLDNISIEVPSRSLTILKGRSGSGKTTLINLLGALDRPDQGEIWFGDREITRMGENVRDQLRRYELGFVFQSVALISTMTAYENVEFGLRVARCDKAMRRQRVQEVLELVGLKDRMLHRTQELSGGEQQRVAIARAIAHKPKVVFADEPTAELDTAMGLKVVGLFKNLISQEGLTVVMTSHDPSMMALGDRIFDLENRPGDLPNDDD